MPGDSGRVRGSRRRRPRSAFQIRQDAIARRLEGTHGPKKYAGEDMTYTKNEAKLSAGAIAASIGRKKYGQAEMTRRSVAGRRRR